VNAAFNSLITGRRSSEYGVQRWRSRGRNARTRRITRNREVRAGPRARSSGARSGATARNRTTLRDSACATRPRMRGGGSSRSDVERTTGFEPATLTLAKAMNVSARVRWNRWSPGRRCAFTGRDHWDRSNPLRWSSRWSSRAAEMDESRTKHEARSSRAAGSLPSRYKSDGPGDVYADGHGLAYQGP
jgi:hypothetical protein